MTTERSTWRLALGVAIGATLLLAWLALGVGIIGADGDPANRLYLGVAGAGILGALIVRLRPGGMAVVALGVALAVAAVGGYAILAGLGRPFSGALELLLLNGFFVTVFLGAAALFRRAARGRRAS